MNISDIFFKSNIKFPKELHHITTVKGWAGIQRAECLIPKKDDLTNLKGVFAFDMQDFIVNWNTGKYNFAYELLYFIRKKFDGFALVKINVDNPKDLFLRSLTKIHRGELDEMAGIPLKKASKTPVYENKVEYIFSKQIPIGRLEFVNSSTDKFFEDACRKNLKINNEIGCQNVVKDFMKRLAAR